VAPGASVVEPGGGWDNPRVPTPPRILVTNDDGYAAEGIRALVDALESLGEVWMVAPASEQSGASHALTLERPLRVRQLADRRFAVDGTPTDCVALALSHQLRDLEPALVVSGINAGPNMGADVHYSGTVSAAFEGVILGLPAIAVSQVMSNGPRFEHAASFTTRLAAWVLANGLPGDTLLNVNVPAGLPRGVRLTRLGVRRYTEGVIEDRDPRGRQIFWIGGGSPVWERIPGTDFNEVAAGWISVTPLHLDLTGFDFLNELLDEPPPWAEAPDGEAASTG
jgi:5'-nucleotidase